MEHSPKRMRLASRCAWACVALAVLSGCGSKSSGGARSTSTSAASPSAFVARANAICGEGQTGPGPGPFPFPSFDPLHPNRSELPAIGRYFEHANALPILRRQLAQLRALGTPPKDQPQWHRLLAAMQSNLTATASQYQAALTSDASAFVSTVHVVTNSIGQERVAALAFGATGCVPPGANQAGPSGGIPSQAFPALAACMRARGVAVQAGIPGKGPPLITRVPVNSPRYQAAGAKCSAQLASRFPGLAHIPTPP